MINVKSLQPDCNTFIVLISNRHNNNKQYKHGFFLQQFNMKCNLKLNNYVLHLMVKKNNMKQIHIEASDLIIGISQNNV